MDGLIATMSLPGSANTDVFSTYIEEILVPQLWIGAYVIINNLSVHKATRIREMVARAGAEFFFCLLTHPIFLSLNYAGLN